MEQNAGHSANIGFLPSTLVLRYVRVGEEKTHADDVRSRLCWQDAADLHLRTSQMMRTLVEPARSMLEQQRTKGLVLNQWKG